jgi:hypothetical protein
MAIDSKRIRTISELCAVLAKYASTIEERELFADLSFKWLTVALDREAQLVELHRFEDDGGAASVDMNVERPSF